jgi:hypothetical protein
MTTTISKTNSTRGNTTSKTGTTVGGMGKGRGRQPSAGVGRLVRRLERERRTWTRRLDHDPVATELAWRAGVAEGLRLAQTAIRRGV